MGELWLMRHGWAQDTHPQGDEARSLTEQGQQDVLWLAQLLRQQGTVPHAIWTSPWLRARQTAGLLQQHWSHANAPKPLICETSALLAPGLQPDHLDHGKLSAMWPDYEQIVLWVGHWPDMALLSSWLCFGCAHPGIVLQPGSLAMLTCKGRFGPERAQLSQLLAPYKLRAKGS